MPQPKRPASVEIADDALGPAAAIDHIYERLKLIVVTLEYAEAEARRIGSEETIQKATAALASARRDLAFRKVGGYERAH